MEITYHWKGDCLIPDLKLSDTTEYYIGKYGRMRQRFLEENHRGIYSYMLLSETLWRRILHMRNLLTEVLISAKILYRKGVTVKQRFASVIWLSQKQPNFGRSGCFFDVFYFFWSARY